MATKYTREGKGNSLIDFPRDFTIIDIETTGLDTKYDDIIELAAVKVRDDKIYQTFQSFVDPHYKIPEFITELTGITNDMLFGAPSIEEILPKYVDFIGNDIIIGHYVHFDYNFIYDNLNRMNGTILTNDFVDTLRLCNRLYPEMKHHRLIDMVEALDIEAETMHRALADCKSCLEVLYHCKEKAILQYGSVLEFANSIKRISLSSSKPIDILSIKPKNSAFDTSHPLYQKECVFTGTLEKMKRADAMQIVVNLGGTLGNTVTRKTNYLVLGDYAKCKTIKGGKSSKHKKAEELKLKGQDLEIISEQTFYDMLEM